MTTATIRQKGLSGTALKMIALVLMVFDHVHYFFGFTGAVPEWFSMLGRVSAPLFLFCTAEGFAHTHDRRRYILRLWAIGAGMGLVQLLLALFERRLFVRDGKKRRGAASPLARRQERAACEGLNKKTAPYPHNTDKGAVFASQIDEEISLADGALRSHCAPSTCR